MFVPQSPQGSSEGTFERPLFPIPNADFDTPNFNGIEFHEIEAKSIINRAKTPWFDYTINAYRGCSHACTYCFARPTHEYLGFNSGSDFETKIQVKVNAVDLARKEIGSRRWGGHRIAMGTATDPYQRAEGRYKLTRGLIEVMARYRNPFSILTKGVLITRDIDVLTEASRVTDVSVAVSIPTLDVGVWRTSEPGAPHPRARMDAVRKLNEAGIDCGVMMMPILPGLSDHPNQLMDVVKAAVDAGATSIIPGHVYLRPGVKEQFMEWLDQTYPTLVARYGDLFKDHSHVANTRARSLQGQVAGLIEAAGGLRKPAARWNWTEAPSKATVPTRVVRPRATPEEPVQQLRIV